MSGRAWLWVCVCVERWRWRKWVTGWIWSQRMDSTAPVSDQCQTEMLKVTGALAPPRVPDQPGMQRLSQNQAWRLCNGCALSSNESLKIIVITVGQFGGRKWKNFPKFQIFLFIFLVCREGLESSGMPTVFNNTRSQTPDRLSSSSDTRRVRVSNTSTHPAALWENRFYLNCFEFSIINKCTVFVCSLMEQRALPAYTSAILRRKKELPAITRITPDRRPSPSPGRLSHRVLTTTSGFLLSCVISSNSISHHAQRPQMCWKQHVVK